MLAKRKPTVMIATPIRIAIPHFTAIFVSMSSLYDEI
jgi:hypothetical protein